ncbi:MAG: hypothetical protein MZV70_05865 [Desulfobacterales bacterium]|nr:hypothetical protein [Desulfobacterales bacterium]
MDLQACGTSRSDALQSIPCRPPAGPGKLAHETLQGRRSLRSGRSIARRGSGAVQSVSPRSDRGAAQGIP